LYLLPHRMPSLEFGVKFLGCLHVAIPNWSKYLCNLSVNGRSCANLPPSSNGSCILGPVLFYVELQYVSTYLSN
jgi:hypothetical protein